jgi:hypothetical protein
MSKTFPLLQQLDGVLDFAQLSKQVAIAREIQQLLIAGGFLSGPADGIFGPKSQAAFKAFKRAAHLEYEHLLGASTREALLEIEGLSLRPLPVDFRVGPGPGTSFRLPSGEVVTLRQPIEGCQHFTWGEATHTGTRIPASKEIVSNIIKLAQYLELMREFLGNRLITITSWYRPPSINAAAGGANNSTHLIGLGVDFVVEGVPPLEVYKKLHDWHGSKGGLGKSRRMTHLDRRGYLARWVYSV